MLELEIAGSGMTAGVVQRGIWPPIVGRLLGATDSNPACRQAGAVPDAEKLATPVQPGISGGELKSPASKHMFPMPMTLEQIVEETSSTNSSIPGLVLKACCINCALQ